MPTLSRSLTVTIFAVKLTVLTHLECLCWKSHPWLLSLASNDRLAVATVCIGKFTFKYSLHSAVTISYMERCVIRAVDEAQYRCCLDELGLRLANACEKGITEKQQREKRRRGDEDVT